MDQKSRLTHAGKLRREECTINFQFSFFGLLFIPAFFLFSFSFSNQALAAGLAVTPSSVNLSFFTDETKTITVEITNPTSDVVFIEAYPDDFTSIVTVVPKSMMLEALESSDVSVSFSSDRAGRYETFLSVVSHPLTERSFSASTGIKIPLHLEVAAKTMSGRPWWLYAVAGIDVILLSVLILLISRRTQNGAQRIRFAYNLSRRHRE